MLVAAAATAAVLLKSGAAAATTTTAAAAPTSASMHRPLAAAGFLLPSSAPTRSTRPRAFTSHQRALAAAKGGRPSLDDVERISKGQAAKRRGVGSRAVCHRLNEMERKEFELAKKLGFVQLRGTGYRRERKGSPLANIHRQLCDALARPCIEIHRGLGTDAVDEVVVDLSPLRPLAPGALDEAWAVCQALGAELLPAASPPAATAEAEGEGAGAGGGLLQRWEEVRSSFSEEDWETRAIWCVTWRLH